MRQSQFGRLNGVTLQGAGTSTTPTHLSVGEAVILIQGKLDSDPPHSCRLLTTAALVLLPTASLAAPASVVVYSASIPTSIILCCLVTLLLNALFTTAQMTVASIGPSSIGEMESRKTLMARALSRFVVGMPRLERQFSMAALFALLLMAMLLVRIGFHLLPGYKPFAAVLAVLITFFVQVLFIEVLARNVGLKNSGKLFPFIVPPAYVLSIPALLFVIPYQLLATLPSRRQSLASLSDMHLRLLPSLRGIERLLDEDAFDMIDSVREFAEATAEDVMTPRTEVEAIPDDLTSAEVYERVRRSEYSRLVVYHEIIDNVVGTLLAKEVLLLRPTDPWSLLRKPLMVSEKTRLPELLRLIRANRTHLVVVLDEYGGMAGIVTLHDLFETIVGHIEDVEDEDELWIERIDKRKYRLNGRVELWELNEELNTHFDEESARTIGGLVFNTLGRVAQEGDFVQLDGTRLTVESAGDNRVEVLLLEITPADELPIKEAT